MSNNSSSSSSGIGVLGLLGVLFVGLKLTDVIDWSWWWVTLPFWGGAALIIGILLIYLLFGLAFAIYDHFVKAKRQKKLAKNEPTDNKM